MGFHPVNLGFRFVLELVSLVGVFRLGLELGHGAWRWVVAFGLTLAGMALWASFRVPGDGSAGGEAPFPTTGLNRLAIEAGVFGAGALGWFLSGPEWLAWSNLVALGVHHIVSYDRLAWLIRQS